MRQAGLGSKESGCDEPEANFHHAAWERAKCSFLDTSEGHLFAGYRVGDFVASTRKKAILARDLSKYNRVRDIPSRDSNAA